MSACLFRKFADFQGRVLIEASRDGADPARGLTVVLPARPCQEPSDRFTHMSLGCLHLASLSEVSRVSADGTSNPSHDGQTWKQLGSNPGRIELDLDLFESYRRGGVAMMRPGPIEDCGWPGNEPLAHFGLVQIGADNEERKNGPVMGVLRHAGAAPVDDPSDTGSAEASQHLVSRSFRDDVAAYINAAAQAVKRTGMIPRP